LGSTVILFYQHHGVEVLEHEAAIEVKLWKNPKSYTKGEIIDTEPRFVYFMDILGFSAMVDEYDSDSSSNILQKLQAAFKDAMQTLTQYNADQESDIKYLEYRVFSDCICISLPYFDNEANYSANLTLMLAYVRGLQTALMTRGVFTRGGIAAGPYYMDENILFSGAMIRAYKIESKEAIYPRVVLDNGIIIKLHSYPTEALHVQSVFSFLVQDDSGLVFLNPFNSLTNSANLFRRSVNSAKTSLFSQEHEEDELSKLITGFANSIIDWSVSLVEDNLDNSADESLHKLISQEIRQQRWSIEAKKTIHINDPEFIKILDKSLAKYEWLECFMNWAVSDNKTEGIFFKYL
jgi:hypothetical protein